MLNGDLQLISEAKLAEGRGEGLARFLTLLSLVPVQHDGDAALVVHDLPRRSLILQFQGMDRLTYDLRDR